MGGVGSGGRRPGAGRPRKSDVERALAGNSGHRNPQKVVQHPSSADVPPPPPLPTLDEADAPNELTFEERKVWLELAPYAISNGTLVESTSLGFRLLCKNIALERQYSASVMDKGSANHRGIIQRIDHELLRFNLAPNGKPVAKPEAEKPKVDPLKARYFGGR